MNSPSTTPDNSTAQAGTRERPPIVPFLITALCFGLLAVSTVWGSVVANRRTSAHTRELRMHETNVAAEAGIDLAALRRGRELFMGTCTACHGPNGEALPNLGKDLAHSEFVKKQTDSQLKMFLMLGRQTWDPLNTTGVAMPGKGGNPMITDDNLKDIVQFLRYLTADAAH